MSVLMNMNIQLGQARPCDIELIRQYDRHISAQALSEAVGQGRCFIITADDIPVGVMRGGMFWDSIPFLNLIYIDDAYRRRGIGAAAMKLWEQVMKDSGHGMVMLSTQSDEPAQHFYRSIGYRESGCLMLDLPGYEQPMELIFVKGL